MMDIQAKPKMPRVLMPDFYKFCCKVLEAYLNYEGKIPQLVNIKSNKNSRRSRDACPFLLLLVPNLSLIKSVIENVGLFNKFEKLSPLMAYIIVGDLLLRESMSERLKSLSYPVASVMSLKEELQEEFFKQGGLVKCRKQCLGTSPRWLFTNSLHATVDEVKNAFFENGYYPSNQPDETYDSFLDCLKNLGPGQYLEDFHLPGLLALPPLANVSHSQLFAEHKVLLLDKASCLPPLVSGVIPGMTVVDACAAPGNKTILLANLLKGRGRLIAIDRDVERFSLLKTRLSDHGAKNVRCVNKNFTDVPHGDLQGVQVVLVDPSCTNSGVAMHTNDLSSSTERIRSLACMQVRLLSHALSIPGVQTVVYSTCSVHYEENEGVVEEAMLKFGSHFELEDLGQRIKQWKHFGMEESPFGSKVLRTIPEVDLCHGFFVAKFVAKAEVEEREDWTGENLLQEEWNEKSLCDSHEGSMGSNSSPDVFNDFRGNNKAEKKKKKSKCDSLPDDDVKSCLVNSVNNPNGALRESKTRLIFDKIENDLTTNKLDDGNLEFQKTRKKCKGTATDCGEDGNSNRKAGVVLADDSLKQVIDAECCENTRSKKKKRKHIAEDDCRKNVEIKNDINIESKDSSENASGTNFQGETMKGKKRRRKNVCVSGSIANDDEDGDHEKRKKRKSKKNLIEDELFVDESDTNFHGENSEEKSKKEKKRFLKLQENGTVDNGIDNGESKKNKRNKRKNLCEKALDANRVDIGEGDIVESKKKKKKKNKLEKIAFNANDIDIIEDEIIETSKERRRRKEKLKANIFDSNEGSGTREEKIERKKDSQENASGVDEVDIVEENTITKKKKKYQ